MNELVSKMQDKILERLSNQFNYRKSNKIENEIYAIFKSLRSQGKLRELEHLLTHENNTIVSYAAQFLLVEDEEKALKALHDLSKRKGVDPFTINLTIEQWKKGELNFDY